MTNRTTRRSLKASRKTWRELLQRFPSLETSLEARKKRYLITNALCKEQNYRCKTSKNVFNFWNKIEIPGKNRYKIWSNSFNPTQTPSKQTKRGFRQLETYFKAKGRISTLLKNNCNPHNRSSKDSNPKCETSAKTKDHSNKIWNNSTTNAIKSTGNSTTSTCKSECFKANCSMLMKTKRKTWEREFRTWKAGRVNLTVTVPNFTIQPSKSKNFLTNARINFLSSTLTSGLTSLFLKAWTARSTLTSKISARLKPKRKATRHQCPDFKPKSMNATSTFTTSGLMSSRLSNKSKSKKTILPKRFRNAKGSKTKSTSSKLKRKSQ